MFPQIPATLSGLSLDQLTTLRDELAAAGRAWLALDAEARAEHNDDAVAGAAALADVKAEIARREALAAAAASFTDDPGDDDDGDDTDGDEDGDTDEVPASSSAIERPGVPSVPDVVAPEAVVQRFVAFDSVSTDSLAMRPGEAFQDWNQLAAAMIAKAASIRSNSSEKFKVARLPARFMAGAALSESAIDNLRLWDNLPEMTAAWCAAATPIYDIDCQNTTRRPVKAALMNFPAPRAHVSIHPSPALSDIVDTATGIWTIDDDDDDEAVKGPCATITCGTPEEFDVYGVYACMTVKNLLTLNYPELIAAYLNRLSAAHARKGEIQLLNAMAAAAASTINVGGLGYGASTTITTQLMQYLALYREQQRWDDQPFELWAHRWLQTAVRVDLSRRNRDGSWSVATEADANRIFTDAGFMPRWFIDQPSWSQNLPSGVHTGGVLNTLPDSVTVLVNPVGKYAVMDRGELSVGVTGNNIYRDNASNERNQFTYFFENFEGAVDTGCAPSHLLNFDGLCYDGAQIADVAIDCTGELMEDRDQGEYSS